MKKAEIDVKEKLIKNGRSWREQNTEIRETKQKGLELEREEIENNHKSTKKKLRKRG